MRSRSCIDAPTAGAPRACAISLRRRVAGMLVALVTLVAPATGPATVLSDWSLGELIERSDRVVIGVVREQRTLRRPPALITETRVTVERTLLGPARDTLTLTQLGGRDGTSVVEVVGDARLRPGDRVLLFTYAHPDGRRYLVGMALGAYRVLGDRLERRISVPVADRAGRLRPAPGLQALSLGEVERAIRSRR